MKSRLSLTVDPKVTHRAKRVARTRKQSLSALVEELLAGVSLTEPDSKDASAADKAPFSQRWADQLQAADRDEVRYRRLAAKYDLP